jgi:carbamoyl-phosphate synthase small subunit
MIPSKLILESGEAFSGLAPEWQKGIFFGEVVFTTGMTGYVESLTDPSYAGQILSFSYPLIGNYTVPDKKFWESGKIQASGVIVGSAAASTEHWNGNLPFLEWLEDEGVPLLSNVDTRALTKRLRKNGVVLGAISDGLAPRSFVDPNETDLIAKVTCKERKITGKGPKRIIAVDCGMKENIMRSLSRYPLEIVRVPYDYDYSQEDFNGLFISNGPGDPRAARATIAVLKKALARKKPAFGICLGAQLMALAIGATTYKLKFGHRGQNHPCLDLKQDRAILTSQNHGYAIDSATLPSDWETTFVSLNDRSVEGIAHKKLPFFAVQFHPESHPGPTDAAYLFDQFYELLSR